MYVCTRCSDTSHSLIVPWLHSCTYTPSHCDTTHPLYKPFNHKHLKCWAVPCGSLILCNFSTVSPVSSRYSSCRRTRESFRHSGYARTYICNARASMHVFPFHCPSLHTCAPRRGAAPPLPRPLHLVSTWAGAGTFQTADITPAQRPAISGQRSAVSVSRETQLGSDRRG